MKNNALFFQVILLSIVIICFQNLTGQSYQLLDNGNILFDGNIRENKPELTDDNSDSLIIRIELVNIPDHLTFSQDHVDDYYSEYWWGVIFDADNNPGTGINGFEIEIALNHWKGPGDVPFDAPLLEGTYRQLIEWIKDSTITEGFVRHADFSARIDPTDSKTIIISVPKSWEEISEIDANVQFYAHSEYLSEGGYRSDITDVSNTGTVDDPAGDAAYNFIDIVHVDCFIPTDVNMGSVNILPGAFNLKQNFPNPFNPITEIKYTVPHQTNGSILVYNAQGRTIRILESGTLGPGNHSAFWNGCDDNDNPVSSGVYLIVLKAGAFTQSRKALLIR